MSIITTAPAVPSRLFTLYASLVDRPDGESRDTFERWATPSPLATRGSQEDEGDPSTSLLVSALSEARRIGIVTETDGKIRVNPEARPKKGHHADLEDAFRGFVSSIVLDTERAMESQQDGFMMALSWFLGKSPFVGLAFTDGPQAKLKHELGENNYKKTELTSINRYQNFLYWAWYLGFATFTGGSRDQGDGKDTRYVLPNPIKAIERVLPSIFAADASLPAETFFARLAKILPVLEGGVVREEVESWGNVLGYSDGRRVSAATSFALQRLKARRTITFDAEADSAPVFLDLGEREERVAVFRLGALQ